MTNLPSLQTITSQIITLPERPPAMLQDHIAEFYGVPSKVIGQAVSRNPERFPDDFAFRVTDAELASLRSQNVTSDQVRYAILAFTEAGALALSGVLKSARAAEVSVMVHRGFVALRQHREARAHDTNMRLRHLTFVRKPIWGSLKDMINQGEAYAQIQRTITRPEWQLLEMLADMLALGLIDTLPKGTPDAPRIPRKSIQTTQNALSSPSPVQPLRSQTATAATQTDMFQAREG